MPGFTRLPATPAIIAQGRREAQASGYVYEVCLRGLFTWPACNLAAYPGVITVLIGARAARVCRHAA
jgi:hypothetical protein